MSISTCNKCGGFIPLGPKASNRCVKCGAGVFESQSSSPRMDVKAILEAASKNGTVRLSIESSSKQAKLSFWTNSHHATGVLELKGELEDVLTMCALKLGIDVDGNALK